MSVSRGAQDIRVLREEWRRFVEHGYTPTKIRPAILASWYRCREWGVNPYSGQCLDSLSPDQLRDKLKCNRGFTKVIKPYMAKIYDAIKGQGYVVYLTDSEGYVLHLLGDKEALTDFQDNLNFRIGVSWSERAVGTTAIGMVLAVGEPVPFMAEEKFCLPFKERACSAVPIKNPDGQIAGALGIAASFQRIRKIDCRVFGMLLAAEMAIENHFKIAKVDERLQIVSHYYKALFDSVSEAIVVIDEKGLIKDINSGAQKVLSLSNQNIIGQPVSEIIGLRPQTLALDPEKGWQTGEAMLRSKRGKVYCRTVPVAGPGGGIDGFVGILTKNENGGDNGYARFTFKDIIGESRAITEAKHLAETAARSYNDILLVGETGTGKELFAQAIHNASPRNQGPFIAINCGAVPKELIESEFFGYEEGAFTGARKGGRPGMFEIAKGGTILLDEIGEMPGDLQVRLLRVLEEREVRRVGGSRAIPIDVRVIAATNRDLPEMVRQGKFREDLYWRINVITIEIPPLRERLGDIRLLAQHFLNRYNYSHKQGYTFDNSSWKVLLNHDWPGNVRELKNVLERAITFADSGAITRDHLQKCIPQRIRCRKSSSKAFSLGEAEKDAIELALQVADGNISRAASLLGIARNTLYGKLKKYAIEC